MTHDREFDIVLFGATGFTGKLAAEYLAKTSSPSFRWAIAGRSAGKLGTIRDELKLLGGPIPEVITADASNASSLVRMASRARVVMSTVGPYALHGEPLVGACVEAGTDYVDITGEPVFVASMIQKYDALAREKKLRIVHCCGFDSIPHDLGVHFAVKQLAADQAITVRGFVRAGGTISGGTWASALNAFADPRGSAGAVAKIVGAPAQEKRKVGSLPMSMHREASLSAWAVPLPTIDPAIVLRSASALEDYGPAFLYGHYARVGSLPVALGGIAAMGTLAASAQVKPIRKKLLELRPAGEGPSAEQRRRGFFEVDLLAESGDGKKIHARVAGGEPGYHETSKMISESALCLAHDRASLPERFGVITTATAMGDALRARLIAQGMRFEILS